MATTTTTTTPTGWVDQAQYGNFQNALQLAQRPYQQYGGPQIADWNTGQLGAYQAVMGPGGATGADTMGLGRNAAAAAAQYNPQMVNQGGYAPSQMAGAQMGRGEVQNVLAGSFPGANLGQYMNPYTSSVIDQSMNQLGRQNSILQNQANARASAAGAFGGSRQAVMNSENNRNFMDTAGRTIAGLNQANFGQAQSAIQADQNRALQAAGMNQGMDWNTAAANLANRQAANTANMAARNAAGQFNSDLGLRSQLANQAAGQNAANSRLSAANALNGMGLDQQRQLLTAADAQMRYGTARQAQDQARLNQQQQNWQAQQDYPLTQLRILQGGLNGASPGSMKTEPYYDNTLAQVGSGLLGGAQLLSNAPEIINGAKTAWNGLSGLFGGSSAFGGGLSW